MHGSQRDRLESHHVHGSAPKNASVWRLSCFRTNPSRRGDRNRSRSLAKFLFNLAMPGPARRYLDLPISREKEGSNATLMIPEGAREALQMSPRAALAYAAHKEEFPSNIWHCCKRLCFETVAILPEHVLEFHEAHEIHKTANALIRAIETISDLTPIRRPGMGEPQWVLSAQAEGRGPPIPVPSCKGLS